MSDISKIKINDTTYNIKDANALTDAPSNGEEYVRKNGNWAISSGGSGGGGAMSAMYYYEQTVNVASNSEIMRITDSRINTNSIVLECTFADPSYISDDVTWTSYAGYMAFTGTCTNVTTANVTIGYTTSDNFSDRLMTLLWENPNPTSSFAAQTLSNIDTTNYDFILVETKFNATGDASYKNTNTVGKNTDYTIVMFNGAQANNSTLHKHSKSRVVNITDSSIAFGNCYSRQWNDTSSNAGTISNEYVIPLKIYGISRYNYFEEKPKTLYKSRKGSESSIRNNGTILSLTVPPGRYLVNIYNCSNDATAWLAINNNVITDMNTEFYAKIFTMASYSRVFEFLEETTISLVNKTGSSKTFYGETFINAINI